jgi:hypothetical protein
VLVTKVTADISNNDFLGVLIEIHMDTYQMSFATTTEVSLCSDSVPAPRNEVILFKLLSGVIRNTRGEIEPHLATGKNNAGA